MIKISTLISLLRNIEIKSYKQGETIIERGSTNSNLYFMRKGLVRAFANALSADEEEVTFQLYAENNSFGNIHKLILNQPSSFTYQALEDSKVYTIEHTQLLKKTKGNPDLLELKIGKRMFEQAFRRLDSFVFLSPEERYLKYVKDYPTIINRAPDKYIANVLGITPTSLSRIRKRIASKKD